MSEVYLAHDEEQNCDVAIKVVSSHYVDHVERLQREANVIRALNHEHILPILDYVEGDAWHYLVIPYMEHGTLRERLTKGPLPLVEAGSILEQIADALQFAHDQGILHRDIKPSNILLGDEHQVFLADFGLAKVAGQQEHSITQTGCLIGTPEYMAPELAEEPYSKSCDIYALGVLLYQMVTGQVPFKGSTPMSVYWKHIQEQPAAPSLLNPTIPRRVDQVILRALEKDPRHRFKSAQELAQAYLQAIHPFPASPIIVRVLPMATRLHRPSLKPGYPHFPRAAVVIILLLLLLISSLWLGFSVSQGWAQREPSQLLAMHAQLQTSYHGHQENPTPTLGAPPQAVEQADGAQLLTTQIQRESRKHSHVHKHKHDRHMPNAGTGVELE